MAVWNQPGPGVNGPPRRPRGVDADGLPSLKVPRAVTFGGAAALLVAVVLFAAAVAIAPRVHEEDAVEIDQGGQSTALSLLEDTEYGFFSADANAACTVFDPAGTALDVYPLDHDNSEPPQVLGFRSTDAGTYAVTCTGASAIIINQANVSPEWSRSLRMVVASMPFAVAGLVGTVVGAIWLVARRRRRTRAMMNRLFPYPPVGAPVVPVPPPSSPRPGTPVAPPTVGYGLAPQQVVYRPLPPPDGGQGV
ncbi:hypothetical protein [Actinomyces succiniciruminis]|uniref:Uncharacterized protein n=1 Tax=Actinomyces succiniciruminis TaxID=1522002 RepID=A0A1L7RQF3_9ACTO|nr:hypothetical protein [Actinomyces succiniciruminis]CED92490.1 Hypothetical protein AAM4_2658 [Actinomyces succiniciruminis]